MRGVADVRDLLPRRQRARAHGRRLGRLDLALRRRPQRFRRHVAHERRGGGELPPRLLDGDVADAAGLLASGRRVDRGELSWI